MPQAKNIPDPPPPKPPKAESHFPTGPTNLTNRATRTGRSTVPQTRHHSPYPSAPRTESSTHRIKYTSNEKTNYKQEPLGLPMQIINANTQTSSGQNSEEMFEITRR